jgi:hypothetical protein
MKKHEGRRKNEIYITWEGARVVGQRERETDRSFCNSDDIIMMIT